MSSCFCLEFNLTVRPGGSAAAGSAPGPAAHSSCRWGANQRHTITSQRYRQLHFSNTAGPVSPYLSTNRLHTPAVRPQRTWRLTCLKSINTNRHLVWYTSQKQFVIDGVCIINNNNNSKKKATVGEQKHENSLWQGVELLLDQPLNLVLLAVVSGTEGLKSVKWLRSHPPCCKHNWARC